MAAPDSQPRFAAQALNSRTPGIASFVGRFRELQRAGAFKGRAYGPIAAELTVRADAPPHAAAALENAVAARMFGVFVVESAEDRDLVRRRAWPPACLLASPLTSLCAHLPHTRDKWQSNDAARGMLCRMCAFVRSCWRQFFQLLLCQSSFRPPPALFAGSPLV